MPDDLLARMPAARLGAMSNTDRAEQVSTVAHHALEAWRNGGEHPADLDHHDLAKLLGAVGEAWKSAQAQPISLAEQMRWSVVCAIANQIAKRWRDEINIADDVISALARGEQPKDDSESGGTVLALYRGEIRRGT